MEKLTREELVSTILDIQADSFYGGLLAQEGEGQEALRSAKEKMCNLIKKIYDLDKIEDLT